MIRMQDAHIEEITQGDADGIRAATFTTLRPRCNILRNSSLKHNLETALPYTGE